MLDSHFQFTEILEYNTAPGDKSIRLTWSHRLHPLENIFGQRTDLISRYIS